MAGKNKKQESALRIRRVYDRPAQEEKSAVYLVDRLWPRGVKKERLKIKGWIREVGPSDGLRHWFGHDPARWPEFKRRYFAELRRKPEVWGPLAEALRERPVTLLFAAKDTEHNNAVALKEFLEKQNRGRTRVTSHLRPNR